MADRYHNATTLVLTAGTERAWTHGLTAGGAQVAPDEVNASYEHGASIGANCVRVTNKGANVCSVILDKEINPTGSPIAITVRLDAVYWHSLAGSA